jgi:hypothetical protein
MRKLCIDELGGVKMKKKVFYNMKKPIFFTAHFWATPLALHLRR